MAPKPMPVRISKPGLKNVFEYRYFRYVSIFLPARLASREMAVVSNPFQPAFSVWVTNQFASVYQIASAWTCEIWSCFTNRVRIPRRSPAVQVVLFRFFLFGGPAGYFPEARAPDRLYWCPQAKDNRARKYQIQVLGFTESVWSVTCMRNQQRALLTHYWLF